MSAGEWTVGVLLMAAVAMPVYERRAEVYTALFQQYYRAFPCSVPIPYVIDSIDPRFHLSTSSIRALLASAASEWSVAAGKPLFVYSTTSPVLHVRFTYDRRQQTTDVLKQLNLAISNDKASYDAVRARYDTLAADFAAKKSAWQQSYATYQTRLAAYQKEVNAWNKRGGVNRSIYDQLNQEKAALEAQQATLRQQQTALNQEVAEVNALATEVNKLAASLNLGVVNYNTLGASMGPEFEEGLYTESLGHEEIDIFEYDSSVHLSRVLMHELGHALGLEHVDDPEAIMYKLNQGENQRLIAADLEELRLVCRLK